MATGRMYGAGFSGVLANAGDIIQVVAPAAMVVIIHELRVAGDVDETSKQIKFTFNRAATEGSGGATPTPRPFNPGDAAASAVVETLNTIDAVTLTEIFPWGENIIPGLHWVPTPEMQIILGGSDIFVLRGEEIPGVNISGHVVFEELG